MLLCSHSVWRYLAKALVVKLSVAMLTSSGKPTFVTFLYYIGSFAVCAAPTPDKNVYFSFYFHFSFSDANSPAEGDNTTQVVFGVEFNDTIPKAQLPRNEAVVQTLVDAANSNNSYSVQLNSQIQIICKSSQHLIAASLRWPTIAPLRITFLPFPQQVQYLETVRMLHLLPPQWSSLPAPERRSYLFLFDHVSTHLQLSWQIHPLHLS